MTPRARIEAGFERGCDAILRRPKTVVMLCLVVVGVLATGLPQLRVETSFESYLPVGNRTQALYEVFREEFGSGERIVVLLEPEDVYDVDFLRELRQLHEALETGLPFLDDLTSLVNARHLEGGPGTLVSEGLLDEPITSELDLARLRERIESSPLYENVVISTDHTSTALIIELDGSLGGFAEAQRSEAVLEGFEDAPDAPAAAEPGALLTTAQARRLTEVLDDILAAHAPESAEMYVAGTPLLAHRLGRMLTRDIVTFVTVSVVLTALLLFALFRSFWAMVHPLLVVALSVAGTLGWMGLLDIPITAVTEILPSLLVAMGVGDAIHIQAMFYRQREGGDDVQASIRWAMGHSGLAVTLTSLTTAASMAAFQSAELQPIIDLGRVAPIGIALALVLSTTLLPALLVLTPMDPVARRAEGSRGAAALDRVLLGMGQIGIQRPLAVVVTTAVLLALACAGAYRLRFSQDDLRWLPADDPVRVATEELNRSMGGAEPFELFAVLEDGLDVREPMVLEALQDLEERVARIDTGAVRIAQSLSLVDVVEETHRALSDRPDIVEGLPSSRAAVSQELLLFESAAPDDLPRFVATDWNKTRIAMTVPFADALHYPRFAREVAGVSDEVLAEHGLDGRMEVAPTGLLMVAGEMFELLFVSMVRSYAIAFGVIALLMLALIGNFRLGLLSSIPNVTPILIVMGSMGWAGTPLDISSLLVGGILIGVVVDDTIHFAHNFARYRAEMGCAMRAIRQTLVTTGRAMLATSVVLSIGFFSFTGASLTNISDFGLYCGFGVVLAFVADVVLFPALIVLTTSCRPGCDCGLAR